MFNTFINYIKLEFFTIIYRALIGSVFAAMSFVFFVMVYKVEFFPKIFNDFLNYF